VIALAGPMALNLLAVITATLFGRPYPKVDLPSIRVVPVILLATFFALGEELGWRGFALPRLQARFGALVASLMVGLLWWAWHLPEILAGPSQGLSPQQIASLEFRDLAIDLAASILMAWVYNNTRGSLFLVALFHVGIGLLSEFVTLPSASSLTFIDIVLTAGLWLIAAILIQIPRVYFPLEKPEAL
jgi:membrane protease YdiL (CAAX protease family)